MGAARPEPPARVRFAEFARLALMSAGFKTSKDSVYTYEIGDSTKRAWNGGVHIPWVDLGWRREHRARSTFVWELGHNRECNQPYGAVRVQPLAAGRRQVDSERSRNLGAHRGVRERGSDNMMSGQLRMLTHFVVESVVTNHQLREIPYGN